MQTEKAERIRGVADVMPNDCEVRKWIQHTLEQCFASFGYRPIDVPIIEYTSLYLRKGGEEIVSRLYEFTHRNRHLTLRPEMTASVVRAYGSNLLTSQLPVRLYYTGPVFRYEKPQQGRYRQFTQTGLELIGASGAMANAELLSLGWRGLERVGLANYSVVIGHVGILTELLDSLSVSGRLRTLLLTSMDMLRSQGRREVEQHLQEVVSTFNAEIFPQSTMSQASVGKFGKRSATRMTDVFQSMDESETRQAMLSLLQSMGIRLHGIRDPDEIVQRLLAKINDRDETERVNKVLDFMTELGALNGEPLEVLKEACEFLTAYEISHKVLDELRATIELLDSHGVDWSRFCLDLGLSRGLQYNTGMIFEIHHGSLQTRKKLCSGGRHDDLVSAFGFKRDVPAAGLSYGVEQVQLALESERCPPIGNCCPSSVLVIPVGSDDNSFAIMMAEQLRQANMRVEMAVRERSIKSNLRYADKQGIPFAIVVGSKERLQSKVVLRDLTARRERCVAANDVAAILRQMMES